MSARSAGEGGSGEPTAAGSTRRRRNPVLVVVATVGCLHLLYLGYVEADRMVVQRREVHRLEREVAALESEIVALREVAAHADDASFRELLARKQGFVFPDELRVVTQDSR